MYYSRCNSRYKVGIIHITVGIIVIVGIIVL